MNRLFLFLFFLPVLGQAQVLDEMKKKYPDQISVFLKKNQEMVIDIRNNKLEITNYEFEEMLHLTETSKVYSTRSISDSYFHELLEVKAISKVPEKKGFREYVIKDYTTSTNEGDNVFFDDVKLRKYTFPGVNEGTITILKYTQNIKEPNLLPMFHFQYGLPVEEISVVVKVNKAIRMDFKKFNFNALTNLDSSVVEKGNYVYYTWTAKNIEPYQQYNGAPEERWFMPHIVPLIKSYTASGTEQRVLSDLDDLHKWNYKHYEPVIKNTNDSLKILTSTIVGTGDDELTKVSKIYAWVQNNVRYVAFEDGMRGFVPHTPEATIKSRYGDCKDMATLLYALLRAEKITSHITLIGTRDLPYKYSTIQCPCVANHVIVTYKGKDRLYFLDPTSRYNSFRMPSSDIQGKEGMLLFDGVKYEVQQVPYISKNENEYLDSINISLIDKTIKGTGTTSIYGFPKLMLMYSLADLDQEKEKKFIRDVVEKGGNKFYLHDYSLKGNKDNESPIEITYSCEIQDYVYAENGEAYVNMNLDRTLQNNDFPKSRKVSHKLQHSLSSRNITELAIPDGYEISMLPNPVNYQSSKYGFEIKYYVKGNKVFQQKNIFLDYDLLSAEEFEEWNKFIKQLNKAYREVVILKKTK